MRTPCVGAALFAGVVLVVSSAAAQIDGRTLPPPGVSGNPDGTVTTGPTAPAQQAPQLSAITARTDVGALVPFDLFNGLKKLSANAALVWATTSERASRIASTSWPLGHRA